MNTFFSVFGAYDFFMRDAVITLLLAYSVYVLLNAGIFAVPQIGFMACGAYTASIADVEYHWPLYATILAATVVGAVAGALLGALLARLNGIYLALGTIAFSEIVRVAAQNMHVTGGLQGLYGIDPVLSDWYILGSVLLCLGLIVLVRRSRHGIAIAAMRADPLMTAHQGVNLARYRLCLFIVSGGVAGVAGSLNVHLTGFVEPTGFTFAALTTVLAAVVVGGMTNSVGPILGVALIVGAPQVLGGFAEYRDLVNGVVIIAVVALAPGGIASWLAKGYRLLRAWRSPQVATPAAVEASAEHIDVSATEAEELVSTPPRDLSLQVQDVVRAFGGVKALQGVSFEVRSGEVFGLIGPNGSGKSTMLNILSGVYKPSSGSVRLGERDLDRHFGNQAWVSRAGVARTFQNIRLIEDLSVGDNIRLGGYYRLARRSHRAEVAHDMQTLVADFGLDGLEAQDPSSLPYGLQRRVEICRALLSRPEVLMLDEPTAGMTPSERSDVFAAIRAVADRGILVIVVEHDVQSMLTNCDRIATLHFGRLIALGEPKDVIESKAVIEAYVGTARG
jgi:branched-chain amino acid transport system permease protein